MAALGYPLKTILPYHADLQNEPLPTGWAYCDGTTLASGTHDISSGTFTLPDLRNRYLLGADLTKATTASGDLTDAAGGAPGPTHQGGANSHNITVAEMPEHTHNQDTARNFNSFGGHGGAPDTGSQHIGTLNSTNPTGHTGQTAYDKRPRSYGVVWIMKVKH